jgi:cell volume regulation protein A
LTDSEFALILLGIGGLLTAAFITNNLSRKFGIPSLLLYLTLGLFFGNGGDGDFLFDNPQLVERCAELALGLILFKGGYEFRHSLWARPKVLAEGVTLALLGTLLTALFTAGAAILLLNWHPLEALLLGAVLSSTDAAAVFSVFQSSELRTTDDTIEVLEIESSTNDPLAYALVVGLVAALLHPPLHLDHLIWSVGRGLALGLLVGGSVGLLMVLATMVVKHGSGRGDLMTLAVLTSAMGLAQLTGANPLITAFTAGVVLSSRRKVEGQFWGPFVALSEVVLFLLLGLQVFPKVLWAHLPEALLITLVLMFFSRPFSVLLISPIFVPNLKRGLFISWAGLRGASPIVFGLLPMIAGVPKSQEIFATVFAVVVVSVLIQGTTLGPAARKLGLVAEPDGSTEPVDSPEPSEPT